MPLFFRARRGVTKFVMCNVNGFRDFSSVCFIVPILIGDIVLHKTPHNHVNRRRSLTAPIDLSRKAATLFRKSVCRRGNVIIPVIKVIVRIAKQLLQKHSFPQSFVITVNHQSPPRRRYLVHRSARQRTVRIPLEPRNPPPDPRGTMTSPA